MAFRIHCLLGDLLCIDLDAEVRQRDRPGFALVADRNLGAIHLVGNGLGNLLLRLSGHVNSPERGARQRAGIEERHKTGTGTCQHDDQRQHDPWPYMVPLSCGRPIHACIGIVLLWELWRQWHILHRREHLRRLEITHVAGIRWHLIAGSVRREPTIAGWKSHIAP